MYFASMFLRILAKKKRNGSWQTRQPKKCKEKKKGENEQRDTGEKKSLRKRFVYMLYSCTGGLLSTGSLTRSDSQT